MRLRAYAVTVQIECMVDDGTTLTQAVVPLRVPWADLPKLADMIELARARAEAKLAATPPKEASPC